MAKGADQAAEAIGVAVLFIAIAAIVIGVTVGMADMAHNTIQGRESYESQKAKYMKEQNCRVTGYYGRSGERKVYTCDDGKVWRESDL